MKIPQSRAHTELLTTVGQYYEAKLAEFGPTARGVDWNSSDSQNLRFEQLLKVCNTTADRLTLNDYGCGYGALLDYAREAGYRIDYRGFDISSSMTSTARALHSGVEHCSFTSEELDLTPSAYTLASGIFNVRLATPIAEWESYVHMTLDRIASLSQRGFAFNMLTSYSDRDRMRDHLYYANPAQYFDMCKRRFSRNVALLHDYDLFEFTILVRL